MTGIRINPELYVIQHNIVPVEEVDFWQILIEAMIEVESGGDSLAVGYANDVGILQITPICLRDANRIVKENRYKLKDRYSKQKSIEIFNIIQNHYNPDKDIQCAIRKWNPGDYTAYSKKVEREFNKICPDSYSEYCSSE